MQSRDNLVLKFERHAEKLREIFENYAEPAVLKTKPKTPRDIAKMNTSVQSKGSIGTKIGSKTTEKNFRKKANKSSKPLVMIEDVPEEENGKSGPKVKLKKLDKIMDDISYLTGTCITTFPEFSEGTIVKKSTTVAKTELAHYIWKRLHDDDLLEQRKTKHNKSIFKNSNSQNEFVTSVKSKRSKPGSKQTKKSQKSGRGSDVEGGKVLKINKTEVRNDVEVNKGDGGKGVKEVERPLRTDTKSTTKSFAQPLNSKQSITIILMLMLYR